MKKLFSTLLLTAMIIAFSGVGFANEKSNHSGSPGFVIHSQDFQVAVDTAVVNLEVVKTTIGDQALFLSIEKIPGTIQTNLLVNDVGKLKQSNYIKNFTQSRWCQDRIQLNDIQSFNKIEKPKLKPEYNFRT